MALPRRGRCDLLHTTWVSCRLCNGSGWTDRMWPGRLHEEWRWADRLLSLRGWRRGADSRWTDPLRPGAVSEDLSRRGVLLHRREGCGAARLAGRRSLRGWLRTWIRGDVREHASQEIGPSGAVAGSCALRMAPPNGHGIELPAACEC